MISNNQDFYESIDLITKTYNEFREGIKKEFFRIIKESIKDDVLYISKEGKKLIYAIDEDGDGFYISFYLVNANGEKIKDHNLETLSLALRERFTGNDVFTRFRGGPPQVFWENIGPFKKFLEQDKLNIYRLRNQDELDNFIRIDIKPRIDRYKKRIVEALEDFEY